MYDAFYKVKAEKSPSVNGIYSVMFKNLANAISKPLSYILAKASYAMLYHMIES